MLSSAFKGILGLVLSLAACTRSASPGSQVAFLAGPSATLVAVEPADLNATFLFGAVVTDSDSAGAALLGQNSDLALPVSLRVATINGARHLTINTADSNERLLAFKVVNQQSSSLLVDFAKSPSEIAVLGAIDANVASSATSAKVTNVTQTRDSMTVDVAYTGGIPQATGAPVAGHYSVRYWWKRRSPDTAFATRQNIDGLGYFTTAGMNSLDSIRSGNISRLDLDNGPISFTLVDFPAEFVTPATQGIKAWERGLGEGALQVHVGSANIGDPNTIVVRWYVGLPSTVPFAGLTYTSADPDSGERAVSAVLINGATARMQAIFAGTQAAYQAYLNRTTASGALVAARSEPESLPLADRNASLHLGGLTLQRNERMEDSAEFLPGLFDETVSADAYIQAYYRMVVMHEVGHVMGLRHNFRGSLVTDPDTGTASSIMDYADNQQGNKAVTIGSYDLAAIRYGYFGETPAAAFEFCSDEDQAQDAFCNQFDGTSDLVNYFHTATQQVLDFTLNYDFDPQYGLVGMKSLFKTYYKIATIASPIQAAASASLQADLAAITQASAPNAARQASLQALRERAVILQGQTPN